MPSFFFSMARHRYTIISIKQNKICLVAGVGGEEKTITVRQLPSASKLFVNLEEQTVLGRNE